MCTKERSKSPVHFIACLSPCTSLKLANSEKDFKYLCHKCGCPKKEMQNMECLSDILKPEDQFQEVDLKMKDDRSPGTPLDTICQYCGHSSLECYRKVKAKENCACGEKRFEPKVEYKIINDRKPKRKPSRKRTGCFCEQKGVKCPLYQDVRPKVINRGNCVCSELKKTIEKSEGWAQTDEKSGKQNYSQTEFEEIGRSDSSTQVELLRSDSSAQTDAKIKSKPAQTQTEGQKKVIISNYSSEPEKELSVIDGSRTSTPKRRRKRGKSFRVKDKRRRAKNLSKTNQNEKQTYMIPTIEIDSQDIQRILNIGSHNEYQRYNLDFQRSNCSFETPVKLVFQQSHCCKRNSPTTQSVFQCSDRKETTL